MANNSTFEAIRERSAVRRFSTAEVSDRTVIDLLELANCAPSGFNLQPWHFVVVKNPEIKQLLKHIAMDQAQVLEAPVVVVFVADPAVWKTSYPEVLELGLRTKQMTERHVAFNRKTVQLMFKTGPFGLFGLLKKIGLPIRRLVKPTPHLITSRHDAVEYVRAQTMFAAATFMIAAKSIHLETSPMEGFDEERLKKLLAIPSQLTVPLIVALGHPLEGDEDLPSVRLPLERKLSLDIYPNKVKKLPARSS